VSGFEKLTASSKMCVRIMLLRVVSINPLAFRGSYSATLSNMWSWHTGRWWAGGLLHLVQRGGDWAGPQSLPRRTKSNSQPINGQQCTSYRIAVWWSIALRF